TGAASGMGRAITLRLASEGARVLAHDVNGDGLAETARLAGETGGEVEARQGDLPDGAECRVAADAAVGPPSRAGVRGSRARGAVNGLGPGGTDPSVVAGYTGPGHIGPELMAAYVGLRGLGTADDIAGLFAYLASDDAKRIHGAIVSIDGGLTAG